MFGALRLQVPNPALQSYYYEHNSPDKFDSGRRLNLGLVNRRFTSLSVQSNNASSEPSIPQQFTATVGSPPSSIQLSQWNLTHRHILMLNFIACAAAVSATWLFLSAIPALLAFKKAAESMEKLLDVTREELPDTMAAVRLSGMEISDLTMELSDLSQEITQGVRSSTRAVRVAEERLRGLTNIGPSASMQEMIAEKTETAGPMVAKTARGMKEGIVKGRALLQMFFTFSRFSKMSLKYFASLAKR